MYSEANIGFDNGSHGRQIVRKRLRIYSKARFITFVTILFLIGILIGGYLFGPTAAGSVEISTEKVMIHQGDTIWAIAGQYDSGEKSLRAFVNEICRINEIDPGAIYPGTTIEIPIYGR